MPVDRLKASICYASFFNNLYKVSIRLFIRLLSWNISAEVPKISRSNTYETGWSITSGNNQTTKINDIIVLSNLKTLPRKLGLRFLNSPSKASFLLSLSNFIWASTPCLSIPNNPSTLTTS